MRSTGTGPNSATTHRRHSSSALGAHAPIVACWIVALTLTIASAIYTRESGALPPLLGVGSDEGSARESAPATSTDPVADPFSDPGPTPEPGPTGAGRSGNGPELHESGTRWFDGRPIRPSRVIVMRVTGYSPDARSCGIYADGRTATLYSVWTNAMRLAAADPEVLPYWSLVSVPGYHDAEVVPVLDCGGAIKGAELDLLFPTHEHAVRWGVRSVPVTVWEYADE